MTKALPNGEAFYFSAYFSLVEKFARNFSKPGVLALAHKGVSAAQSNEEITLLLERSLLKC